MSGTTPESNTGNSRAGREISPERMAEIRRSWSLDDAQQAAVQFERLEDAASESSISGQLRRAIHDSGRSVTQIANAIGIEPRQLGEWLEGQRNLRSDILDRIGLAIQATVTVSVAPREANPRTASLAHKS